MSSFKIECPTCGGRAASEFTFGGESIPFPTGGAESPEENYERVWLRDNARGRQAEQWFHFAGCRRWVYIERDTLTNATV